MRRKNRLTMKLIIECWFIKLIWNRSFMRRASIICLFYLSFSQRRVRADILKQFGYRCISVDVLKPLWLWDAALASLVRKKNCRKYEKGPAPRKLAERDFNDARNPIYPETPKRHALSRTSLKSLIKQAPTMQRNTPIPPPRPTKTARKASMSKALYCFWVKRGPPTDNLHNHQILQIE